MKEEMVRARAMPPLLWIAAAAGLFAGAIVTISRLTPGVGSERERAMEETNLDNMQQLARACLFYAEDNGGMLPESLEALIKETNLNTNLLYSPFAPDHSQPSYELAVQGSIEPGASAGRVDPEVLYNLATRDRGQSATPDAAAQPDLANVILIIERENLRHGPRRFVFLNGTPGSLAIDIPQPKHSGP